ncbi:hypothetical protein [Alicyclobacillus mengziensis]|uniref:Uncharacterized protein n=1 Tax=Alicyclobacillus mengziensis TaxID=2931921 RepID=A0A9X7W1M6_9BACL|nr:hypothetical protein [Alicyclobacillus mengziensis]QSO48655.1 hypothetical protein JZ786_06725 [Alicyclobacillus mengziensis]
MRDLSPREYVLMRLKEARLPIDVVEKVLKQLECDELSKEEREEILNREG